MCVCVCVLGASPGMRLDARRSLPPRTAAKAHPRMGQSARGWDGQPLDRAFGALSPGRASRNFSIWNDDGFQLLDSDIQELLAGMLTVPLERRWSATGALEQALRAHTWGVAPEILLEMLELPAGRIGNGRREKGVRAAGHP